jgi:hypothetical protein
MRFSFGGGEHFDAEEGWYIDDVLITDEYASSRPGGDHPRDLPLEFAIREVTPNPCFDKASVTFEVPRPVHTTLCVFDILGRRLFTVADGTYGPGRHKVTWHPEAGLAPGMYFVRMSTPEFGETRKLIVLRPSAKQ